MLGYTLSIVAPLLFYVHAALTVIADVVVLLLLGIGIYRTYPAYSQG